MRQKSPGNPPNSRKSGAETSELRMSERGLHSVSDGQAWIFPEAILFVCFVPFAGNSNGIVPA
jgi:hypothetical protein